MKNKGFTLAEVLITLGIIGVISALVLPSLITNTASAQIGPKLAKAASSVEQANARLLDANSIDALSDAEFYPNPIEYMAELSNYLKMTRKSNLEYISKDGISYRLAFAFLPVANTAAPPHTQLVNRALVIDINGDAEPNTPGEDQFAFSMFNDGSLKPWGGVGWNGGASSDIGKANHWQVKCPKAEDGSVSDPQYCAGHIFENNLKVLYR